MRIIAVIEAPLELVQIGWKMLHAHLVIGPNDASLEQRPHAFHAIRVNVSAHPFLGAVIHALVLRVLVLDSAVALVFIRHNALCLVSNHLIYKSVKHFLGSFFPSLNFEMRMSAALDGSKYHRLVSEVSATDVTALSADIRFIHFHSALEHLRVRF